MTNSKLIIGILAALFFLILTVLFIAQKQNYQFPDDLKLETVLKLDEVELTAGSLEQGILYYNPDKTKHFYFSSNQAQISKFDSNWNLIETSKPVIENISDPHIGILSTYEEYLWGGVIDLADYPYSSDTRINNTI